MSSNQTNVSTSNSNSSSDNMDGPPVKKQKTSGEDHKPKNTSGAPEYMSHRWHHETPEGRAALRDVDSVMMID